jgi:hypothetical protein
VAKRSPDLAKLRIEARRARSLPLAVADIEALALTLTGSRELDDLARRATPVLFPGDATLAGLRALHAGHPESRALGALHGIAALALGHAQAETAAGRTELRAEAARALESAHAEAGTVRRLLAALGCVDRFAAALQPLDVARSWTEPSGLVPDLGELYGLLGAADVAADARVVLAPLDPAARALVRARRVSPDAEGAAARSRLLERVFSSARGPLTPVARAGLDFRAKGNVDAPLEAASRLEADAAALDRDDALLAATLIEEATELRANGLSSRIDRSGVAACTSAFDAAERLARGREGDDALWARALRHRLLFRDASLRIAAAAALPDASDALLDGAIERIQVAYGLARSELDLVDCQPEDARLLVWALFLRRRFDEVEPLFESLPDAAKPDASWVVACARVRRGQFAGADHSMGDARMASRSFPVNEKLAREAEAYVRATEQGSPPDKPR